MSRWIPIVKKGALHHELGYPLSKKIPTSLLESLKHAPLKSHYHGHAVTPLLKRRVNFALNVRR